MEESTSGRRKFLALAAGAGAAMVAGPIAREPVAAAATGVDYAALKRALKGPLLRPGDPGYSTAAKPYNAALGVRKPAAIPRGYGPPRSQRSSTRPT